MHAAPFTPDAPGTHWQSANAVFAALLVLTARPATPVGAEQPGPAPHFLNQSWSASDRAWFYTASQGSQIMPYAWFMSLERPDDDRLFVEDGLARFGYLPNPYDGTRGSNRSGLPIGFVKDVDDRGEWIGMTCAACHVNRIDLRGRSILIDGGPADADMFAFIEELGRALAQTRDDGARFERFARRVIPAELSAPGAGPSEAGDARDDDASRRREMIEAFGEGYDPALEARAFASDEARRRPTRTRRRWARATASRSIPRETFPNPIPRARARDVAATIRAGRANPRPLASSPAENSRRSSTSATRTRTPGSARRSRRRRR